VAHGAEKSYQEFLSAGSFRIQQCEQCKGYIFYPRVLCPDCGSSRLSWQISSGLGTVYSTTVTRRRKEAGGDFNVCLVDLDEGPRLMSRVEGVLPENVCIGMRVKARISVTQDAGFVIVFDPAEDQE
jgi:uncharacterized OB-fold protein